MSVIYLIKNLHISSFLIKFNLKFWCQSPLEASNFRVIGETKKAIHGGT